MVKIGARAHDFGRSGAADLAARIATAGADCIQLAPAKAIADCPGFDGIAPEEAAAIAGAFASKGVSVAVLGCYEDVCGRDAASRARGQSLLSRALSLADAFGTKIVATETPLSGCPREEAQGLLLAALEALLQRAEGAGSVLCLEPVWDHAIGTPQAMRDIIDRVGSKALGVVLDPVNLVDPRESSEGSKAALEAIELFGERVAAVHVKDYVLREGSKVAVRPGEGLMDWRKVALAVAAAAPDAPFIVEEQDGPGFAAGRALLRSIFA